MPIQSQAEEPSSKDLIATLILEKTNEAGPDQINTQFPIFLEKELRIGRDASICHLVIRADMVSKQHFRIYSINYYEEDENGDNPPPLIYCEDLESVNGTWVNDSLIGKIGSPQKGYLLSNGDLIRIEPHWDFRFYQKRSLVGSTLDKIQEKEKEYFADQYTITQRILGTGFSAAVYLAHNKVTKSQMACKIVNLRSMVRINARDEANPEFIKPSLMQLKHTKCAREVDILSKLDHPNVTSLQKAFRSEHTLFLFQELATGGDLFSYLQFHGGILTDLHSRIISRQIALALQYVHSQGVAHRDLKIENILVTHTDIGHRVLLTDFGGATYVANKATRLMSLVGTAGYQAPEVIGGSNKKGYTKAVDMWAFGAVTLCLLTGGTLDDHDTKRKGISTTVSEKLEDLFETKGQPVGIGVHARDFLKKLHDVDEKKRMDADQAVSHDWFARPKQVTIEMNRLYERANRHWIPRKEINVVEILPEVVVKPLATKRPKISHCPITSNYFDHDQHPRSKVSLEDQKAVSLFQKSSSEMLLKEVPPFQHRANSMMAKVENHRFKVVKGNDLFSRPPHRNLKSLSDAESDTKTELLLRSVKPFSSQASESQAGYEVVQKFQESQDGVEIPISAQVVQSPNGFEYFGKTLDDPEPRSYLVTAVQESQDSHRLLKRHRSMSQLWTPENQSAVLRRSTSEYPTTQPGQRNL